MENTSIADITNIVYHDLMKAYSMDLRKEAVRQLENGLSVRRVAKNLGVHFITIQRWKKRPSLEPTRTKPPDSPIDPDALRKDVEDYPDTCVNVPGV